MVKYNEHPLQSHHIKFCLSYWGGCCNSCNTMFKGHSDIDEKDFLKTGYGKWGTCSKKICAIRNIGEFLGKLYEEKHAPSRRMNGEKQEKDSSLDILFGCGRKRALYYFGYHDSCAVRSMATTQDNVHQIFQVSGDAH